MLRIRNLIYNQTRQKSSKKLWAAMEKKSTNKKKALDNFDDFYSSVYGKQWNSIRVALLTEHKYIALINNFGDTETTRHTLEADGAINVKSLFNLSKIKLKEENLSLFTNKTEYKLDNKMNQILKQQENKEKESIYPTNSQVLNPVPDQLNFNKTKENAATTKNSEALCKVNPKQSLEQTIEEHSQIDLQRIVKADSGMTGGMFDFVPATQIKGMEDWVPESQHYKYYKNSGDYPQSIEIDTDFHFPENLQLYTYEKGNCSNFIPPSRSLSTGVLTHFLMDGASILPPLFLNLKKGDKVLDACAAPGGKSLIMLQTLYPEILICNDIQESRINRIRKVMSEYMYDFRERWENKRVLLTQQDARNLDDYEKYDKILVDVPCTTDRHSVNENDNNIFKPGRIKERLRIPELQANILSNCLRLLRPGGSLVYSTCSLSPIQNDGVVNMALQKAFIEYGITVTIKDLSLLIKAFETIFKFDSSKGQKFGQLVLPYLPANFGPMYFSKLTRN